MKIKKTLLIIAFLLTSTLFSFAAPKRGAVEVSNVIVSMDGTVITIRYDLAFGQGVRKCNTKLQISLDDGKNFNDIPRSAILKGDLGRQTKAGQKVVTYDIESVKSLYWEKPIRFNVVANEVDAVISGAPVMVGVTPYPALSFNLMAGYVQKFGGFVKVKSDFSFAKANAGYTCNSNYSTSDGGRIWADGSEKRSMFSISVGGMARVSKNIYPYIGAGYGQRVVLWKDGDSKLVEVSDLSYKGFVVDGGIMFKFGKFVAQIGCSNLACSKGFGADIGLGVMF